MGITSRPIARRDAKTRPIAHALARGLYGTVVSVPTALPVAGPAADDCDMADHASVRPSPQRRTVMKSLVVYESVWGNTAAIARAIAEGLGPDARVVTTDEATPDLVAAAELLVAGSPVFGFQLPTDSMRANVARDEADAPTPPDLSHPSLRSWLESVPSGAAWFA